MSVQTTAASGSVSAVPALSLDDQMRALLQRSTRASAAILQRRAARLQSAIPARSSVDQVRSLGPRVQAARSSPVSLEESIESSFDRFAIRSRQQLSRELQAIMPRGHVSQIRDQIARQRAAQMTAASLDANILPPGLGVCQCLQDVYEEQQIAFERRAVFPAYIQSLLDAEERRLGQDAREQMRSVIQTRLDDEQLPELINPNDANDLIARLIVEEMISSDAEIVRPQMSGEEMAAPNFPREINSQKDALIALRERYRTLLDEEKVAIRELLMNGESGSLSSEANEVLAAARQISQDISNIQRFQGACKRACHQYNTASVRSEIRSQIAEEQVREVRSQPVQLVYPHTPVSIITTNLNRIPTPIDNETLQANVATYFMEVDGEQREVTVVIRDLLGAFDEVFGDEVPMIAYENHGERQNVSARTYLEGLIHFVENNLVPRDYGDAYRALFKSEAELYLKNIVLLLRDPEVPLDRKQTALKELAQAGFDPGRLNEYGVMDTGICSPAKLDAIHDQFAYLKNAPPKVEDLLRTHDQLVKEGMLFERFRYKDVHGPNMKNYLRRIAGDRLGLNRYTGSDLDRWANTYAPREPGTNEPISLGTIVGGFHELYTKRPSIVCELNADRINALSQAEIALVSSEIDSFLEDGLRQGRITNREELYRLRALYIRVQDIEGSNAQNISITPDGIKFLKVNYGDWSVTPPALIRLDQISSQLDQIRTNFGTVKRLHLQVVPPLLSRPADLFDPGEDPVMQSLESTLREEWEAYEIRKSIRKKAARTNRERKCNDDGIRFHTALIRLHLQGLEGQKKMAFKWHINSLARSPINAPKNPLFKQQALMAVIFCMKDPVYKRPSYTYANEAFNKDLNLASRDFYNLDPKQKEELLAHLYGSIEPSTPEVATLWRTCQALANRLCDETPGFDVSIRAAMLNDPTAAPADVPAPRAEAVITGELNDQIHSFGSMSLSQISEQYGRYYPNIQQGRFDGLDPMDIHSILEEIENNRALLAEARRIANPSEAFLTQIAQLEVLNSVLCGGPAPAPAQQPSAVEEDPVEVFPVVQIDADQARIGVVNGLALARTNFEGLDVAQRQAGIDGIRQLIAQSADAAASDAALAADIAALAALIPVEDASAGGIPEAPPMDPRALGVVVADIDAQIQAGAPLAMDMMLFDLFSDRPVAPPDQVDLIQAQVAANTALIAEARAVNAPADRIARLEALNRVLRGEPPPAPSAPSMEDLIDDAFIPDAPALV